MCFLNHQYKNKALLWVVIMALVSFALHTCGIKRVFRAASVTDYVRKRHVVDKWVFLNNVAYIGISVIKQ